MTQRRSFILGLVALVLAPEPATAQAITGRSSARKVGGAPKMIAGTPPKLDFGSGLLIPMDRTIFGVLWEGRDRWITYGRGIAANRLRAMGEAQEAAEVSMRALMLTLAFKPERMEKIEGSGWRLKSRDAKDLVLGRLPLPGKPLLPVTEGFGQGGAVGDEVATGAADDYVHALTGFMVMKTEVDLAYVRQYGRPYEETAAAGG